MNELSDWQIDFAGVLIGPGTPVPVAAIEGAGTPELRTQDVDVPTGDGAFPGTDLYGPRTVRIEAGIRTPGDPAAALNVLAVLQAAADNPAVRMAPGNVTALRIKRPGAAARRLFGRVRRAEAVTLAQAAAGWIPLDLEFAALDPRWYDDTESAITLPLDISQDRQGFTAPFTAPITTGVADPATRPGWAGNDGDAPTWPSLRITGPVANPRIWIAETGRVLDLRTTLRAGERIDIATRPGTRWVLRGGTGNAAPALTSTSRLDLWSLPSGRSEIRWTATDYTNTSRLTVRWRSAHTGL